MWDLWLSRTGKIFLLAAGLAVLVDLIDPDQLRRWGAKAAGRRAEAMRRLQLARIERRLHGYHQDLLDCLHADLRAEASGAHSGSPRVINLAAEREWDPSSPNRQRLVEAHTRLLHRALAAVPGAHSCTEPHQQALCGQQVSALIELIDQFIMDHSSEEEREAYGRHTGRQRFGLGLAAGAVYIVGSIVVLVILDRRYGGSVQQHGMWIYLIPILLITMPFYARPVVRLAGLGVAYVAHWTRNETAGGHRGQAVRINGAEGTSLTNPVAR